MKKYLIVGGSGTIGSEVIRLLKAEGVSVRTTTSKRSAAVQDGVERAYLNVATGEGLTEAFEGVDRAFFLSPAGFADQYKVLSPLIQEAKRRHLEKVVLMTAFGANASEAAPMRQAEIELEKSGVTYNIIRPNWFLQNFNTFWVQGIKAAGLIELPAANAKVSFIDTRDVSEVAAKLLRSDDHANQAFDLTGPDSLDHAEVAEAISSASERTVKYESVAPELLKSRLLSAGLPQDYVEFMLFLFSILREGYSAPVTGTVEALLGRKARSVTEYATDLRRAFL